MDRELDTKHMFEELLDNDCSLNPEKVKELVVRLLQVIMVFSTSALYVYLGCQVLVTKTLDVCCLVVQRQAIVRLSQVPLGRTDRITQLCNCRASK